MSRNIMPNQEKQGSEGKARKRSFLFTTHFSLLTLLCYLLSVCGNPLMEKELEPLIKERERLPDVVVTPSSATIKPGGELQFSAKVNFSENQDVIWSVSGNSEAGTNIDDDGLLTVDEDEAVGTKLTVRAVSVEDTAKSGAAAVTVIEPDAIPFITITAQPEPVSVTQGSITGSLTVAASVTPTGNVSYQWYRNDTDNNDDGTIITGATSASFTIPTTLTEGIYYYFCEISAEGAVSVRSYAVAVMVSPVNIVNAQQPNIETHPVGGSFDQNTDVILSIEATVEDGGELSYQWYINTEESASDGSIINGETENTYTPDTSMPGTTYYYVVVTNTNTAVNGNQTASRTSNVAVITVTETPVIEITTHPEATTTVTQGSISGSLSVAASVTPTAPLSYQWYSNASASNSGGTPVDGATGASFAIPTDLTAGTYYYFCEVSAAGADSVRSEVAEVVVGTGGIINDPITSPMGIEMVWIPAGSFQMGQTGVPAATPVHQVTLTSGFYMGKYQVTQEQYQVVMGTNPSYYQPVNGYQPAAGEVQGRRPVETVRWYDAIVFCNRLSMLEGLSPAYRIPGFSNSTNPDDWGAVPTSNNTTWNAVEVVPESNGYRLPTEAQWEYACRAETTTNYYWGNQTDTATVGQYAWYGNNSSMTHEVGKKLPNAWGLYDMSGNVRERCWDWYASSYPSGNQTDPVGASSGSYRVERGGSRSDSVEVLQSARRSGDNPNYRGLDLGFRVVRPSSTAPTHEITITTQPAPTTTVTAGSISGSLTVAASVTPTATLSYQWYSNTANSNSVGTSINGATSASFAIPTTLTVGTYYYFCEVSAAGAVPVRSSVAVVMVGGIPQSITEASEIAAYLQTQTGGSTAGDPVSLQLEIQLTAENWQAILVAIATAGKFVELDLSECTRSTTNTDGGLHSDGTFEAFLPLADGKDKIVSLVLPDTAIAVSGIGAINEGERHFTNLKSVSGEGIITINNNALRSCTGLTEVNFPAATNIGDWALRSCTDLTEVSFPVATSIGDYAFLYCTGLTEVSFPVATSIGNSAFGGCTGLTEVSFPAATSIGDYAFDGCTGLTEVSFPAATSIGDWAFFSCTSLTDINFPEATSIGILAFASLTGFTEVSFPVATSIGNGAFSYCTSLTEVNFPAATSIGNFAFDNCTSLTEVSFPAATSIGDSAFFSCTGLTEVSFPLATSISNEAFYGCTGLTEVSFPAATSIGGVAFGGCTGLTEVSFPAATSIGSHVFVRTGLTPLSVYLGSNAPTVGTFMFLDVSNNKTVTVKVPSGATGYGTSPTDITTQNWGNAFRGRGWDGTNYLSGYVNANVTLVIEYETGGSYTVGDVGPGGGIIFYHDPAGFWVEGYGADDTVPGYFPGYTAYYLEAASEDTTPSMWRGGATASDLIPTTTGITTFLTGQNDDSFLTSLIGKGRKDTQIIIAFYATAVTNTAANRAADYRAPSPNNAIDDWFLPSLGELKLLHQQRNLTGQGSQTARSWSSSQYDSSMAWVMAYSGGGSPGSQAKANSFIVRAIRAF